MPITRIGKAALAKGAIGQLVACNYGSTGGCIVVGQSTAAHSATSCYLTTPCTLGLSTQDTAYPTISAFTALSTNVDLTFRATFTACQANSCWGEWGIWNATASSIDAWLLNRMPDYIGVKTCAQSWQMTSVVTLTT